jgi:hypothetical protein
LAASAEPSTCSSAFSRSFTVAFVCGSRTDCAISSTKGSSVIDPPAERKPRAFESEFT